MVLAGGTSRRFGRDKLSQPLDGATVLASAVRGLPSGVRLLLVGPDPGGPPSTSAPVEAMLARAEWVREDPPGGGPAAAMIAGLRVGLARPADALLVLPGDAPRAGAAAGELLTRLTTAGVDAVLALDPDGRKQPLQLALRPRAAWALIELAGPTAGAGASARALVAGLTPEPLVHQLSAEQAYDIDTHDQLVVWQLRDSAPVRRVLAALADLPERRPPDRPRVVALAGPGAVAASAFRQALRMRTDATVVDIADLGADWRRLADVAVYVAGSAGTGPLAILPTGFDVVVDLDVS